MMIDFLKDIEEYDMIFFTPNNKDEDAVDIRSAKYKDPGNNVGGNSMGHLYEIILFQLNDDGIDGLDKFEAILCDPLEYVSGLIKGGWFGIVARQTTTSEKIINKLVAKFKEMN